MLICICFVKVNISTASLPVNSDLHFTIHGDGLGGCGLGEQGFANLWAAARATWGLTGGKYFYEVKVEKNMDVELPDTEEHPNALRCVGGSGCMCWCIVACTGLVAVDFSDSTSVGMRATVFMMVTSPPTRVGWSVDEAGMGLGRRPSPLATVAREKLS